jgi:arylsulfatase A-like enzyme
VVHAPGLLQPGRVSEPVSLVDLVPTLQEVCLLPGVDLPLDGAPLFVLDSSRLVPAPLPGQVLAELVVPDLCVLRAAVRGDWKLVDVVRWIAPAEREAALPNRDVRLAQIARGEATATDPWADPVRSELHDLSRDPREERDLGAEAPDRLAPLRVLLEDYAEACRHGGLHPRQPALRVEPEAEVDLAELQQIGYM